ncbi:MAG: hypothetical protein BAJATHORv1_20426 [Candidatus Thorarchaeota archaeon]|nr:MAG: hypothetical protein BAJATHORv1_20426 [Candidatus Thorarchaeota archaeon]
MSYCITHNNCIKTLTLYQFDTTYEFVIPLLQNFARHNLFQAIALELYATTIWLKLFQRSLICKTNI